LGMSSYLVLMRLLAPSSWRSLRSDLGKFRRQGAAPEHPVTLSGK